MTGAPMRYAKNFSPNYATARERFRSAVSSIGYFHEAHSIDQVGPRGEELTIDVGLGNVPNPQKAVVISSGLHGVEGFLGSAIQLALLEERELLRSLPPQTNLILIHALNPYGFAWRRRWNEDNIDLNRNFLSPDEAFEDSPKDYPKLNSFLNPDSPPSKLEPFLLKAIGLILRYGMTSLKNTLPIGQYDYPQGLFYGGQAPSKTQQILSANLPRWVGNASEIIHVDFHTGLGRWGTYKLLVDGQNMPMNKLVRQFGAEAIQASSPEGVAYKIRGGLGTWCQALFPHAHYDALTAEFGTYSLIQIVKALRAENRAFWWAKPDQSYEWTKQQLLEMFAPADSPWREQSVAKGLEVCRQACFPK
jgi:predicted deacylase